MKKAIFFLKSVLLGTLIVVGICGCRKNTVDYVNSEEISESETSESEDLESEVGGLSSEDKVLIYVYVCGQVHNPGVYQLPEGSRVYDLFQAAGGFTEQAATDYWNQASLLTDGEMIYVPTRDEASEREQDWRGTKETGTEDRDNKININTASRELLMTIPGIGEAKADAIIAYRQSHGSFSSIEEVKNVEGIKDGVFSKMENYIDIN